MAAPPHGLCAHDDAAPRMPEFLQPRQTAPEALAHGVVGVVVKALVLPERVDARRHIALLPAAAAKCRNVLISDFILFERLRQHIAVILRVGVRPWHGPNIGDEGHLYTLQQIYKIT
jgi:hypothetical protein